MVPGKKLRNAIVKQQFSLNVLREHYTHYGLISEKEATLISKWVGFFFFGKNSQRRNTIPLGSHGVALLYGYVLIPAGFLFSDVTKQI